MAGRDPGQRLREFVYERWAVIQRNDEGFQSCDELHERLGELTSREAEWFLESVTSHGSEQALFSIEDDNTDLSDRSPPNANGAPRRGAFFEKSGERCSVRLETIVHQAATWRLHDEFGWPLDHLIVESPDIVDQDQISVLRREALDILVLERPCRELPSKMVLKAARSRIAAEAKADSHGLARLLDRMCSRQKGLLDPDALAHKPDHKKCRALDVLRPRFFLGVAAGEDWRIFKLLESDGRVTFGKEADLHCLHRDTVAT